MQTAETTRGYTREEAAKELRVSIPTVDRLIRMGALKKAKIGRRTLISPADINRLINFK